MHNFIEVKIKKKYYWFVFQILSAASHLQVAEAVALCCRFLELALTVDNCVDILNICELYTLNASLCRAKEFILKNFECLIDSGTSSDVQ